MLLIFLLPLGRSSSPSLLPESSVTHPLVVATRCISQRGLLKQVPQKLIPHSSGVWKSEIKVSAGLVPRKLLSLSCRVVRTSALLWDSSHAIASCPLPAPHLQFSAPLTLSQLIPYCPGILHLLKVSEIPLALAQGRGNIPICHLPRAQQKVCH